MTRDQTRTIIDIHVLQTVPPSNINRDDTGSPKTAHYGGVQRARVSSQAWKRATRLAFDDVLDKSDLGVRTKRVVELVAERIAASDAGIDKEAALPLAKTALTAAGISLSAPRTKKGEEPGPDEAGFLLFLSNSQIDMVATAAIEAQASTDPAATLKDAKLKTKLDLEHSIDISLFGRMVADATDLNVDASCQVAHALSVHPVANEFDYFTAVDDHKNASDTEDAGAGMIGTVEFNSSTLYRYATIDANLLHKNLDDAPATQRATEAFIKAFVTSMPTGKQNTFANRTLPDAVVVTIRDTQPVNLVGAFETPVEGHRIRTASEKLAERAIAIDASFGTTPVRTWVTRIGSDTDALDAFASASPLNDVVAGVGAVVSERLQEHK